MRIKITGNYTNGNPYVGFMPKEQLSQADAETFLAALDLNDNPSIDNGHPLDFNSLSAEIVDDEYISPAQNTRLKIALYDAGMLDGINQYMAQKNGKTAIWWQTAPTIDFYHELVQEAIVELNLPIETAKQFWRDANAIP